MDPKKKAHEITMLYLSLNCVGLEPEELAAKYADVYAKVLGYMHSNPGSSWS